MTLTKNQVSEIRLRLANGEKGCDLANEFGVSDSYISQIKSHKRGIRQVWLTLEEAKAIAYKLGYLVALTTQSKTENETLELTDMLWWRIEQAEKGNEAE